MPILIILALGAAGCTEKKVDIRGPALQRMNDHLARAYTLYGQGQDIDALKALDDAQSEAIQYNHLDTSEDALQKPINMQEVSTLRSFILFPKGGIKALNDYRQFLAQNSEESPLALELMSQYWLLWTEDIQRIHRNVQTLSAGVEDTHPMAPLFHYVRSLTAMFNAQWDMARYSAQKAVDLAPSFPNLYRQEYLDLFAIMPKLTTDIDSSIVCLNLCRAKKECGAVQKECPAQCLTEMHQYQLLRKNILRYLVNYCAKRSCATVDSCVASALDDAYDNLTDRELTALEKKCQEMCEENLRCNLISTEMGVCTDYCTRYWSALGDRGVQSIFSCFFKQSCQEARSCYKDIEALKVHPEDTAEY